MQLQTTSAQPRKSNRGFKRLTMASTASFDRWGEAEACSPRPAYHSQRVHVMIWYIPGPKRGSYTPTWGSMYVLYKDTWTFWDLCQMHDIDRLPLKPEPQNTPKLQNRRLGIRDRTPQLPFKTPQIPSNRDQKALNRATLGGVGGVRTFLSSHSPIWAQLGLI